jgi:hypothetical protein
VYIVLICLAVLTVKSVIVPCSDDALKNELCSNTVLIAELIVDLIRSETEHLLHMPCYSGAFFL